MEARSGTAFSTLEGVRAEAQTLRQRLFDLQELAVYHSRLHHSMANCGLAYRQKLDMLYGLNEVMTTTLDSDRARALEEKAKKLSAGLAEEFEILAMLADYEFE